MGILVGDGWELRIQPHIDILKLLFLLTYSLRPAGWEGAITGLAGERDVVQALASGFAAHAERVVEQGLLHGYVAVQERRNYLRGRVRFGDQMARLPGLPLPLEIAYDDFTADIAENQLLRTACEALLLLPRVSPIARARLLRICAALDQVSVLSEKRGVDLPPITRLNRRYEPALVLGKLILDAASLRQDHGPVKTSSFLFDMNEVFESFTFTALRDTLRPFGGAVEHQAHGALDTAKRPKLPFRADVVWRKHGVVRAVIDSKYKSLQDSTTRNADAYQMLAYCIGFGVSNGFLVYARDREDRPRSYKIKHHGYEIGVRSVDLEREPDQILGEVGAIAADIAAGTSSERVFSGRLVPARVCV